MKQKLAYITILAAISLYLLNLVGGMQRVLGPDKTFAAGHYALALLAASLLLLSQFIAWRMPATPRTVSRPVTGAILLIGLQTALAGVAWPPALAGLLAGLHFGLGQAALGLATLAAARVNFWLRAKESSSAPLRFRTPFARLALATLIALLFLLVTGVITSRLGVSDCLSWPLCAPETVAGWLHWLHRAVVGVTVVLAGLLFVQAWRTQRSQTAVLVTATASIVFLIAQALLGARLPQEAPTYLIIIHQATATALWAATILLVTAVGLANRTPGEEHAEALEWHQRKSMAKDLLLLTKPVVVALLLVTTFAGMVIAARALPAWDVLFWTLLSGFLAAGGSGAINQYIDRADDGQMQRTQKRPIPAGRLTEGEGLAFGVAATLLSFYLMLAFVNLMSALLTLAGIVYYVVIYSLWLKKITVQNIVIGGGAGAIPPLVGWAAMTGGLNVPSLFLFAIVFLWTPPHFWALALVRRNDYARANVPMLPVIRGEKETQRQIWIYTIELVALTLLLPAFGLGGSIYLIGAGVLGLWLLSTAWKVWKHGGNKLAWKMYRYSSMYLAFLFAVLMIDALVR